MTYFSEYPYTMLYGDYTVNYGTYHGYLSIDRASVYEVRLNGRPDLTDDDITKAALEDILYESKELKESTKALLRVLIDRAFPE